jgi:hypothetical protein
MSTTTNTNTNAPSWFTKTETRRALVRVGWTVESWYTDAARFCTKRCAAAHLTEGNDRELREEFEADPLTLADVAWIALETGDDVVCDGCGAALYEVPDFEWPSYDWSAEELADLARVEELIDAGVLSVVGFYDTDTTPDDSDCYDPAWIRAWRADQWHYVRWTVKNLLTGESDSCGGFDASHYEGGPSLDAAPCSCGHRDDLSTSLDGYALAEAVRAALALVG